MIFNKLSRQIFLSLSVVVLLSSCVEIKVGGTKKPDTPPPPPLPSTSPTPSGEKEYDLRGESKIKIAQGDTTDNNSTMIFRDCKVSLESSDAQINGTCEMKNENNTSTEVLELKDNQPIKLKKTIKKDKQKFSITIKGETSNNESSGLFDGKSILLEKKDGLWTQSLIDDTPNEEQKRLLKEESEEELYPSKKVKIGDSWEMNKLGKRLLGDSRSIVKSSSLQGTLLDVVPCPTRKNENCALIKVTGDVSGTMLTSKNDEVETDMSIKGTIYRSLSSFVDVESKFEGTMKMKNTSFSSDQKVNISMIGTYEINLEQYVLRKIASR